MVLAIAYLKELAILPNSKIGMEKKGIISLNKNIPS